MYITLKLHFSASRLDKIVFKHALGEDNSLHLSAETR